MQRMVGSGFERLLERTPLAVNVFLEPDGDVVINGDARRNVVTATQQPESGRITVEADGRTFVFDADAVDAIIANFGAGPDVFKTDVNVRTIARGGAGDDLLNLMGRARNRINGGLGQDSVRSLGSFTVFVMGDRDYDRVFEPIVGSIRVVSGDRFSFDAWHKFLSTPNVNAFRGNNLVFTREHVDGFGDERLFYTADVRAKDGYFENLGGLQQLAEGNPEGDSPGGLRAYVPYYGGSIEYVGFNPDDPRYVIESIYVL